MECPLSPPVVGLIIYLDSMVSNDRFKPGAVTSEDASSTQPQSKHSPPFPSPLCFAHRPALVQKSMNTPLPVLFLGHGNPLNAIEVNVNSQAWAELARTITRPRAILVVSAHWVTTGKAVTAMAAPETIHDFFGFPESLAEFQYPAPGDPALALRVQSLLAPEPVRLDTEWGIDHGAWSVLAHLFPKADIPVLQLSLDARINGHVHIALARRLRPLREEGVLIVGSGNIVHNLHSVTWRQPEFAFDWATRFNDRVRQALLDRDLDTLARFAFPDGGLPDARLAVPTPEHFLPLLYAAALRDEADPLRFFNDRIELGSIGMTGFSVGNC